MGRGVCVLVDWGGGGWIFMGIVSWWVWGFHVKRRGTRDGVVG